MFGREGKTQQILEVGIEMTASQGKTLHSIGLLAHENHLPPLQSCAFSINGFTV